MERVPFLQIEPTTRCNYTCGFCAGRHMPQRDLDLADLETFLAGVTGLEHVELQGEGEPLMHPQFFDMITVIRRHFPEAGVSMVTNGSLFTDENIAAILDHRITRVFVSMESADDARFQEIRGGKLARVRRGIGNLLAERARRGLQQPSVGLAVTVLRSTANELFDNIAPLYRELGLDGGINVQPLQGMPQYVQHYDDAMRAEGMSMPEHAEFGRRLHASKEVTQLMAERNRQPGFYEKLYGRTRGKPLCPWLENGLYVTMDGAVVPCCHTKDSGRYAIGRVDEEIGVVVARRRAMAGRLAAGQVPPACTGCNIAHNVAAAHAGRRPS